MVPPIPGGIMPTFVADPTTQMNGDLTQTDTGALFYQPQTTDEETRSGLYVLGHDSVYWVDWFGVIAFLGTVVGVTFHGGLRYLQHADFRRMRESITERRTLMQIAPHLVHPLPVLLPTYGHGLQGPAVFAAALLINDLVSFDRNRLRDPQKENSCRLRPQSGQNRRRIRHPHQYHSSGSRFDQR